MDVELNDDNVEEGSTELPDIKNGEIVQIVELTVRTAKTTPPARYTEGSLRMDMSNAGKFIQDDSSLRSKLNSVGLGTQATRTEAITSLKSDGYMIKKGNKLYATEEAEAVATWLSKVAPSLLDVKMSALWEAKLSSFTVLKDGELFDIEFRKQLTELVNTFRTAKPPEHSITDTEKSMSKPKAGSPTPGMQNYAKSISKKLGIPLPDAVLTDYDVCKAYLDEHGEAAKRPTARQLEFANSIAEQKGVSIPEDALKDGKLLSAWIDKTK